MSEQNHTAFMALWKIASVSQVSPFTIILLKLRQSLIGFRNILRLWIKILVLTQGCQCNHRQGGHTIPFQNWPSSPPAGDTCKASILQVTPFTCSCAFSPCFIWLEGLNHQMGIFRKPWKMNRKYWLAYVFQGRQGKIVSSSQEDLFKYELL